jgi:predicted ATPase
MWLLQMPWLLEPGSADALRRDVGDAAPTRMLREFCVAVETLTAEQTLVLVLEDLHWSDAATIELLGALAERTEPARLLVLASYRPVDAAMRDHPVAALRRGLLRHQTASELSLDLLSESAVDSYPASASRGSKRRRALRRRSRNRPTATHCSWSR